MAPKDLSAEQLLELSESQKRFIQFHEEQIIEKERRKLEVCECINGYIKVYPRTYVHVWLCEKYARKHTCNHACIKVSPHTYVHV